MQRQDSMSHNQEIQQSVETVHEEAQTLLL